MVFEYEEFVVCLDVVRELVFLFFWMVGENVLVFEVCWINL